MSEAALRPGSIAGRLTLIRRDGARKNGNAMWLCSCECGSQSSHDAYLLRTGRCQSCGCLQREVRAAHNAMQAERSSLRGKRVYRRNPEATKRASAAYTSKAISTLNDWYVKAAIRHTTGLAASEIPAFAVEAKRLELSIKRLSKELSK